VQLLTAPFASVTALAAWSISIVLGIIICILVLRSARSSEERSSAWKRIFSNINARYLFGFLFIGWVVTFGVILQLVPHEGAGTPYGTLGLIGLISGTFVMFGFLWSVIGD
jgi:hypothetical protein